MPSSERKDRNTLTADCWKTGFNNTLKSIQHEKWWADTYSRISAGWESSFSPEMMMPFSFTLPVKLKEVAIFDETKSQIFQVKKHEAAKNSMKMSQDMTGNKEKMKMKLKPPTFWYEITGGKKLSRRNACNVLILGYWFKVQAYPG